MNVHHPSADLLMRFASGELDGSVASVISAHVEFCSFCQKEVRMHERGLSEQNFEKILEPTGTDRDGVWRSLLARMRAPKSPAAALGTQDAVEINGLRTTIPRALGKLVSDGLRWMPFGKAGKICRLGEEKGKSLFLIYLATGDQVPLHSHAGFEHSYVIAGSYSSDGQTFVTGDYSFSCRGTTHAPRTHDPEGCLLLSSVEKRLDFMRGWLRPLNAPLWRFLSWRLKRFG